MIMYVITINHHTKQNGAFFIILLASGMANEFNVMTLGSAFEGKETNMALSSKPFPIQFEYFESSNEGRLGHRRHSRGIVLF